MTDRIRRISKIIVCAIVALLFSTCFVACGEPEPIADFGYVATKMNITATVNADCTVDIVEEMTVHYIESSRGWLRYLPCNSGEQYRNVKAEGDEYEMSHDGDFLVIRFGEEDWWYKEGVEADYRIEYTVVLPDLDSDVFEYNIVGTDYDMIRAGDAEFSRADRERKRVFRRERFDTNRQRTVKQNRFRGQKTDCFDG